MSARTSTLETVRETTVAPVTRREVLHRAADLLEEFGHCKGLYAKDNLGHSVDPCDSDATAFCIAGALGRALVDLGHARRDVGKAGTRLLYDIPWGRDSSSDVARMDWNDAPERTRAEVVTRLREAAEAA